MTEYGLITLKHSVVFASVKTKLMNTYKLGIIQLFTRIHTSIM